MYKSTIENQLRSIEDYRLKKGLQSDLLKRSTLIKDGQMFRVILKYRDINKAIYIDMGASPEEQFESLVRDAKKRFSEYLDYENIHLNFLFSSLG